jgi:hypothetical protein
MKIIRQANKQKKHQQNLFKDEKFSPPRVPAHSEIF